MFVAASSLVQGAILVPWYLAATMWAFLRPPNRDGSASHNAERQDIPETLTSRQIDARTQPTSPPVQRPREYIPVPGSWAREAHPQWRESVFKIPEHVRPNEIYYITKGAFVSMGSTAIIERLPCGHIVKSPKINPYNHDEERKNRESIVREASIYRLIGASPFVPRLVSWDEGSCTLVMERQINGNLEDYVRRSRATDADAQTSTGIRQKWALQAAKALATVHAVGVIHHDVAPRNFVLDADLDLRICDFAGSSYPGCRVSICAPGPRYQSRPWTRGYVPSKADDIFSLGSVIYFVMTGEEPYHDLEDAEVQHRFGLGHFPETDDLGCGRVIQKCWAGQLTTAQEVAEALSTTMPSLTS